MFNGGAPGLGGAPVTKALLLAIGGASLALRIRSGGGGSSGFGGGDSPAAGPLARSLGFSTAGELIFAAALLYQSRAAERAMGPAAAASGAALGGLGGAALAAIARALLSALFGRGASGGGRGGGGGGGAKAAAAATAAALGPYPLVFALLVPLVLDVPATTSIVLAGPSSSSSSAGATPPGSPRERPGSDAATTSATTAATSSSSSSSRGIKITDKHFLYFEAAQLLFIGGRKAWLPALAGVAAGAAVRFDVAGLGALRFPPLVSAAAARLLGPLLGWAPIKECVVLPSAASAAAAAAAAARGRFAPSGGGYGLGVAGRAPPPPPPPPAGAAATSGAWAAAAAEPSAASVAQLVAMGFSEPDARAALRRRGGDVSAALSDLLG